MALKNPYASLSEADQFLANDDAWESAEDFEKADSLVFARYYFDDAFGCVYFDEDNAPDEIKLANSLLASDWIFHGGTLDFSGQGSLREKAVEADGVSVSKEFSNPQKTVVRSLAKVKNLVSEYCKTTPKIVARA